jgi:hypothetical protein
MFSWRKCPILIPMHLQLVVFAQQTAAASNLQFVGKREKETIIIVSSANRDLANSALLPSADWTGNNQPTWRLAQDSTTAKQPTAGNPSAIKKDDPDRQTTDVDDVICTALKSEYDKCVPACQSDCESLYEEARECPKVVHRCTR